VSGWLSRAKKVFKESRVMPSVIPAELIHGAVELAMYFITGLLAVLSLMLTSRA
jgi:hypothetical protein